jgi:DNA-binding LacI/PurR family transcriptional regulator
MAKPRTPLNSTSDTTTSIDLRPNERVMEYLLAEFDRPDRKEGSRLPTMRQLASRLNVSQPTVHTVMRRLVKQGRLRTVAGSGTYLVSPRSKPSDVLRIALNVTVADGQPGRYWIHRLAAGITLAVCHSERRIHLAPLPRHVTSEDAELQNLLEERSRVDALILFPLDKAVQVRRAYEDEGKPVVDINPPSDTAMSNFVSTDFYGSSFEIGKAWAATGRKRVVCLVSNFNCVPSERLRSAGLAAGLGTHLGNSLSFCVVETKNSTEEAAKETIQMLVADRASAPDAICCGGDYQALGVLQACQELGLRVPEDVSIVGGTGLDLTDSICPQLTRVKQPFDQLGLELVSVLCERIDTKATSLPGRIIPTGFMGSRTTRPEENEILGVGMMR